MSVLRGMRIVILAAVLAVPAALGGCILPLPPYHTGTDIPEQQVKMLQIGKTTKQELFALFGAPMGIAARGEATAILAPTEYRYQATSAIILSRQYYEIQADTMFELFSLRHIFTEYDRVYYYYYAASSGLNAFLLFYNSESGKITRDQLWVLMNEKSGIVEDYVYRKH